MTYEYARVCMYSTMCEVSPAAAAPIAVACRSLQINQTECWTLYCQAIKANLKQIFVYKTSESMDVTGLRVPTTSLTWKTTNGCSTLLLQCDNHAAEAETTTAAMKTYVSDVSSSSISVGNNKHVKNLQRLKFSAKYKIFVGIAVLLHQPLLNILYYMPQTTLITV